MEEIPGGIKSILDLVKREYRRGDPEQPRVKSRAEPDLDAMARGTRAEPKTVGLGSLRFLMANDRIANERSPEGNSRQENASRPPLLACADRDFVDLHSDFDLGTE